MKASIAKTCRPGIRPALREGESMLLRRRFKL